MLRKFWLYAVWAFVLVFWGFMFLPSAEDPFPLSQQRHAATQFSPWKLVGHDRQTGEACYEHNGVVMLEMHTEYFTERKIGENGHPFLSSATQRIRPGRALSGIAISFAVLGLITWVWKKRILVGHSDFEESGRGFDVLL